MYRKSPFYCTPASLRGPVQQNSQPLPRDITRWIAIDATLSGSNFMFLFWIIRKTILRTNCASWLYSKQTAELPWYCYYGGPKRGGLACTIFELTATQLPPLFLLFKYLLILLYCNHVSLRHPTPLLGSERFLAWNSKPSLVGMVRVALFDFKRLNNQLLTTFNVTINSILNSSQLAKQNKLMKTN